MNKVILMGRLTRDPEIRYSQGDSAMAIARFSLAVDRRFAKNSSDGQTADFINCVAFSKTAEFIEKYTHKGTKLVVEGRIQTGSYTNKDGNKVYTTDVIVENTEFAESKASAANSGYAVPENAEGTAPAKPEGKPGEGFMNVADGLDDEGLPF